eukprot:3988-Heterococcus_DN1.PRE.3
MNHTIKRSRFRITPFYAFRVYMVCDSGHIVHAAAAAAPVVSGFAAAAITAYAATAALQQCNTASFARCNVAPTLHIQLKVIACSRLPAA